MPIQIPHLKLSSISLSTTISVNWYLSSMIDIPGRSF
jgi:hypothetical protein